MIALKQCGLCGCDSNETAIFTCTYAKGELNVCIECLAEGIAEISKTVKKTMAEPMAPEFHEIEDNFTIPEQVFGFNCQGCGNVMFSSTFPVGCECGYINNITALQQQLKK